MKKAKEKMNEKDVQKLFYKTNPMVGISLIVLVITIIIIIILATAVIVSIVGNNPIVNARKAVDDSNIKTYTEQIEMIKAKIMLENDEYEFPTIYQIKEKLDKEKWARSTEIIMDEGIEKLKLITKEGYIFYITANETEYKGKGKVVDTSALKRDDVIELKAEDKTASGQNVRITSKAEDYYIVKYKIGEGEKWTEIESGNAVEVPFGETIYAKLFYGNNSGVEFKLKVGESNPTIVAKSTDTSNMKRKTDIALANLFDITWGSEGTGTVEYEVTGKLLFDGSSIDCTNKTNTKDFELGTYNVKCTIKNPAGSYETSAQKEIKINKLADTSVADASGSNVNANAIYSEYDLAYFRDKVNGGQSNINVKLMNDMPLTVVSAIENGGWIPIGYWYGVKEDWSGRSFGGIFEGDNHNITITALSKEETYKSTGLFGLGNGCTIKNVIINGNLDASSECIGGIVGALKDGIINNCTNNSTITDVEKSYHGGIVGNVENSIIENCTNTNSILGKSLVGGICGQAVLGTKISNCKNDCSETKVIKGYGVEKVYSGNDSAYAGSIGGICGQTVGATIDNCSNVGEVTGNANTIIPNGICAGGIVGRLTNSSIVSTSKNKGTIQFILNSDTVSVGDAGSLGGVVGQAVDSTIEQCFNEGVVSSKSELLGKVSYGMNFIGGIVGIINKASIKNSYNIGEVYGNSKVGGMIGNSNVTGGFTGKSELYNSYNASEIVEGNSFVGSSLGSAKKTKGAYFSCLSGRLWGTDEDNSCTWSNTAVYTRNQMETKGSGLLTLLLNGDGTVDGKAIWAQEDGKNGGLPYLVNNQP